MDWLLSFQSTDRNSRFECAPIPNLRLRSLASGVFSPTLLQVGVGNLVQRASSDSSQPEHPSKKRTKTFGHRSHFASISCNAIAAVYRREPATRPRNLCSFLSYKAILDNKQNIFATHKKKKTLESCRKLIRRKQIDMRQGQEQNHSEKSHAKSLFEIRKR